ncbi:MULTISPECIES: IclR family transcriptional regulator [unclassified Clostridium]|uniref:IclR family transcriptional regulator n=1 Tax=unclassified Clostridium TaxID=2614128 RepID=UPI000297969D|nr:MULTISPECIES: IclR family transcriptional regulator [unclassified Clostridium]EKQ55019.1 MAG: transcriptional regulator [Clostridium sp. Maddingley MBC34-26]
MSEDLNNSNLVQSVERALDILDCLAEYPKGCGIGELSKNLNLSKSTIHRIITTLKYKDYVTQNKENEKYKLGIKLLNLSSSITNSMDLITTARPYIYDFASKVDEVIHLCIPDESFSNIIYVDKVSSENTSRNIVMSSSIGKKAPIYCTASGKLLLSQYSDDKIRELLKDTKFVKYAENTITDINILLDEIHEIRKNLYAFDNIEYDTGVICIAVPIFDRTNKIIAATSLSSVTLFNSMDDLLKYKNEFMNVANNISRLMGYVTSTI